MSRYNTLLFDLDGTLLDTLGDLADSVNYVLSRFCFERRTDEEVKGFIGNGIPALLRRALPPGCGREVCDKALECFIQYYNKNMKNPGIFKGKRRRKRCGQPSGIVNAIDKTTLGCIMDLRMPSRMRNNI